MIPLYHELHFTFRFGDNRIIPRFHLEGVETGRQVSVLKIDSDTGERLGLLATAIVGEGGWVDLTEPIVVNAGDAFIAVPESVTHGDTATTADKGVRLRAVQPADLPRMYDMQLDLESNRVAVTIPRIGEAFDSHWTKTLNDPAITARAVLFGEEFVGCISCFPADGQDHVGFWIERAYWRMGIASRALDLLLREVANRPLHATAATSNGASLRVLQKCGFIVEQVRLSPASERYPECEETVLVLR